MTRALFPLVRIVLTSRPHVRLLALVVIAVGTAWQFPARPAAQAGYTLTQLPAPASDVNDSGAVVGSWTGPGGSRAYVWTQETGAQPVTGDATIINRFPCTSPRINNSGVLVARGAASSSCGQSPVRAARLVGGLFEVGSGNQGDDGQIATAVNAGGTAVGVASGNGQKPFIWLAGGGITVLPGFSQGSEPGGVANGINDAGLVVGFCQGDSFTFCPGGPQAYWWNGQPARLPAVPGVITTSTEAMAVNNNGQIVGRYQLPTSGLGGVFLSSVATLPATTVDLGAPQGGVVALDINDAGAIVATITPPQGGSVPYLYQNGVWTDINTLRPPGSTLVLSTVVAINNQGWMAGAGVNGTGYVVVPPPPNQAPTAVDGTTGTLEDAPVQGTLVATDPNPGDTLTFTLQSTGTRGTAVLTDPLTGTFTYTPDADAFGTDSFTFSASDGTFDSNVATVTVTIDPVNDPPLALDSLFQAVEDTSFQTTFQASDVDSASLTFAIVTNGSKGTATLVNAKTGAFAYAPNPDANGRDVLEFQVSDGQLTSPVTTFTIDIAPVNDEPLAKVGVLAVVAGASANGTLVALDVDSSTLTYAVVANGTRGTATITNTATGAYTYSANSGTSGTDTFTFTASDGQATSNVATVTVAIASMPTATTVRWSPPTHITYGQPLNIVNISAETYDGTTFVPSTCTYMPPTFTVLTAGAHTVSVTCVPVSSDYAPASATRTLIVNKALPPPLEHAALTASWPAGPTPTLVVVDAGLRHAYVSAGASHTLTVVDTQSGAILMSLDVPGSSTSFSGLAVDEQTSRVYVPGNSSNVLTVVDGATGTLETSIPLAYPKAVAVDRTGRRIFVSGIDGLSGTLTVLDAESLAVLDSHVAPIVGDGLAFNPANGLVYMTHYSGDNVYAIDPVTGNVVSTIPVGRAPGSIAVNGRNNRVYVANYSGHSVAVIDGATQTNVATIYTPVFPWGLAVNETNNRVYVTTSLTIAVIDGERNAVIDSLAIAACPSGMAAPPGASRLYVAKQCTGGDLAVVDDTSSTLRWPAPAPVRSSTPLSSAQLNATASITGAFVYDPPAGTVLPDGPNQALSTLFMPADAANYLDAASATTLTVIPNRIPVADSQEVTIVEDTPKPILLTASDADGDALTFAIVSGPMHGALSGLPPNVIYAPEPNYFGSDEFTFSASDGGLPGNVAIVALKIAAVNDIPVAQNGVVSVVAGASTNGRLVALDVDSPALTYAIVPANNAKGTATITDAATGAYTYSANSGTSGTDTFTFTANDGQATSNAATVTVTITAPANLPPIASNGALTTQEDKSIAGRLSASDPEGAALIFRVIANGTKGTATIANASNGRFSYLPSPNANGSDTFTFVANDGTSDSNVATIAVTITPVNDAPVPADAAITVVRNTVVRGTLQAFDVEGDALTFSAGKPARKLKGTVTIAANGAFTYTPPAGFTGAETFTFTVSDGVASAIGTINVTVTP